MQMNDLYLWCVSGVTLCVALNTLWRLVEERSRLWKEDLSDEDRTFAWRIVFFLVFPLLNLLDLRATTLGCDLLGGYMKSWSYGLLWYHAVPAGLGSPELIIPVLFAGSAATTLFAVCLLPSLLFRPHPFFATIIGYTAAFTFGLNFLADPFLSAIGLGGMRWQVAFTSGAPEQRMPLVVVHVACAIIYVLAIRNLHLRLWFSGLTRPQVTAQLRESLSSLQVTPYSARLVCLVGVLYEKAGLRQQARQQLKKLKEQFPYSPYCHFLDAIVAYSRRDYKLAQKAFVFTSDYPYIDGELKAGLLAAAACSAFADNDLTGALNLCERALEFDDACVVSRMVKVDVFLRQGKKEQAGDEILVAMHMGLDLDLEDRIPLDLELAYNQLVAMEESTTVRHVLQPTNRI
jgi:hypothetical protein